MTASNRAGAGALRAAVALIGFSAVTAQVVLMRELMVVCHGNEVSLGLTLASWLLWTAAGSGLAGALGGRGRPERWMALLEVAVAIAFPAGIVLVRAGRWVFGLTPGELPGPGPMLLISLVSLSLFCLISGWLFAAGSRAWIARARSTADEATGSVYLLEAVGSAVGGALASLFLIRLLSPMEIATLIGLLNLMAAAALLLPGWKTRAAAWAVLGGAFLSWVFPSGAGQLEAWSLNRLWKGFEVAAVRNSIYGNLAVVGLEGAGTVYENGLVLFTVPDPEAAEEAVHYALLQHPAPRRVLLIGGGVNGSAAEALKHATIERLDYVELDPAVVELAREHFSSAWQPVENDQRLHVIHTDGRLHLRRVGERYDVIVVNLPDPQTAQINRFYTLEFFREAARKLNPKGVLALRFTGSENYISPELGEFLRCIRRTLRAVFPNVKAMPGATIHFFASQGAELTIDPDELAARLRERNLETMYVREYYLPFRLTPDRVAELEEQTEPRADTPLNRDFHPIAYYFNTVLWSVQFDPSSAAWFRRLAGLGFGRFVGITVALLLGAAAVLWRRVRRGDARPVAGYCVAAMGFTMMGLEIFLLLGFQAVYGYVYQQLAAVIAAFMAGMAAGSWFALRGRVSAEQTAAPGLRRLAALQALAAVSAFVLFGLFTQLTRVETPAGLLAVSHGLFPALALAAGFLGGYQFVAASQAYFAGSAEGQRLGVLYALDLVGACAGALLLSLYVIPVFGFGGAAWWMALVNLPAAALAALGAAPRRAPAG